MKKNIIIAVDGPAGAGKGTISKALAEELKVPLITSDKKIISSFPKIAISPVEFTK
jgi:shikimate kinase